MVWSLIIVPHYHRLLKVIAGYYRLLRVTTSRLIKQTNNYILNSLIHDCNTVVMCETILLMMTATQILLSKMYWEINFFFFKFAIFYFRLCIKVCHAGEESHKLEQNFPNVLSSFHVFMSKQSKKMKKNN